MRLPSLLVMISAITCSSPVLSGAGWRITRAEYCWPSCCQLMVVRRRVGVEQLLRELLHVAREHDLLGLRHDSARAFGFRLGDQRQPAPSTRAVVVRTAPAAGVGSTNAAERRAARRRESASCIGVASASAGASRVCSLVPGSSITSSTGSGAGCGNAASVNSSLVRTFARYELHRQLGNVLVVVDRRCTARCQRRAE